ncbi:cell envelope integrity protein TolA [Halomonas citrativorans]|uniref:Cell envelope integrity protein TolA n=1 Tax=Halomonas citrativorans TaxID=2742612 RepID=A0ABR9F913_9GAMM|nr:cell envelope integrity protein TolA [Halomonas citrativorans]MBE0402985.1 cell envelope integrity protein TolA [Halomonas citrativorans]
MGKGKPQVTVAAPHDPQDVGYTLPIILAVAVHLAIIVFSLINWPSSTPEPDSSSIVQATFVSTETFTDQAQQVTEQQAAMNSSTEPVPEPEVSEPDVAEPDNQEAEQQAAAEAEAQAQALEDAQAAAEAEAQRRAEEAERLAQEQAAQAQAREAAAEAEAQAAAEAEAQAAAEAEAQAAAEAEAQAAAEAEAQAAAEAEAQAAAEAEAQAAAEAEAQREREAEEQRAREEAERQAAAAAEAAMQRQLEGEAEAAANAQQAQQAANSFINIVRRAVEQAWLIPPGASDSLSATLQIRLGPSGELLATSIATSSGDSAFDRSAMQAVEHAAPFGELRDLPAEQQRNLRQFNLRFTPGDVR